MNLSHCRAVDKLSGEWITGWYARIHNTHLLYITPEDSAMLLSREIIPDTLCHCTGLVDWAGYLIYAGDIVWDRISKKFAVVDWVADYARFVLYYLGATGGFDVVDTFDLGIVGDIFHNPEIVPWYFK